MKKSEISIQNENSDYNSSVLEEMLDSTEQNDKDTNLVEKEKDTTKSELDELNELKEKIMIKEQEYSNSLDENLNGDETILQELLELKKKRRKLIVIKRPNDINSNSNTSNDKLDDKETIVNKTLEKVPELEKKTSDKNKASKKVTRRMPKKTIRNNVTIDTLNFDYDKWTINYHEGGVDRVDVYDVSSKKAELEKLSKELHSKYKSLKDIDVSLYGALSEFDEKHGSSSLTCYLNNGLLRATYNLKKLFSNKNYSFKEKVNMLLTAYKQKKYKHAEVLSPKYSLLVGSAIIGCMALGVFGSVLGYHGSGKQNKSTQDNKVVVSNDTETTTEVLKSVSTEVKEDKEQKEQEVVEKEKEVVEKEIVEKEDKNISDKGEEFKLNDNYDLDDMSLMYSFDNPIKNAKTEKLNCKYYKIRYIAVISGNTILDFKKSNLNDQTLSNMATDYKSEYGEDIEIFLNFDGYGENDTLNYPEAGWSNLTNVEVKSKKTQEEKIKELKKLKDELIRKPQQENKSKVYQKTI